MSDTTPEWAKTLINQNKILTERLNALESGSGSIRQQISEKLKGMPASMWAKRVMPETSAGIEAFVAEVKQDYKTDFVDKGLAPALKTGGGNEKATKEEIAFLEKLF